MGRVGRVLLGLAALVAALWFALESLAGTMAYTTRETLCGSVLSQIEKALSQPDEQPLLFDRAALSPCRDRMDVVYRAFMLEFGMALVAAALGVRWIILALRARPARE